MKKGTNHEGLYVTVTPAMAEETLERNTENRSLRAGLVERYARDMKAGMWAEDGNTIKIAYDGTLIDGQHRLWAVIEAGVPVKLIVLTGLNRSAIRTIDTGAGRTYADYTRITSRAVGSPLPNANNVAAVLRVLAWYDGQWPRLPHYGGKNTFTFAELDVIAKRHPAVADCVAACLTDKRTRQIFKGGSLLGATYTLAWESNPTEAERWLQILQTGDAPLDNPARSLRERFTASAVSGAPISTPAQVVYLIKSWNAFARGEKLRMYVWRDDEPIPAIYGTDKYTTKNTVAREAIKAGAAGAGLRRKRTAK